MDDVRPELAQDAPQAPEYRGIPSNTSQQVEQRSFQPLDVRHVELLVSHGHHERLHKTQLLETFQQLDHLPLLPAHAEAVKKMQDPQGSWFVCVSNHNSVGTIRATHWPLPARLLKIAAS